MASNCMARQDWPIGWWSRSARRFVPVPLSRKRLKERGYNQSTELARAAQRCVECSGVERRTRPHASHRDADAVDTRGPLRNVSGAFRVPRVGARRCCGAHVVVVDDIVTPRATLNACAAALCDGGARIVSFMTFGRAPALGDRW
jgi:predicted amidophosphoribosyltransferase